MPGGVRCPGRPPCPRAPCGALRLCCLNDSLSGHVTEVVACGTTSPGDAPKLARDEPAAAPAACSADAAPDAHLAPGAAPSEAPAPRVLPRLPLPSRGSAGSSLREDTGRPGPCSLRGQAGGHSPSAPRGDKALGFVPNGCPAASAGASPASVGWQGEPFLAQPPGRRWLKGTPAVPQGRVHGGGRPGPSAPAMDLASRPG